MAFEIGDIVININTGNRGKVVEVWEDGWLDVEVGHEDIQMHEDDVRLAEDFSDLEAAFQQAAPQPPPKGPSGKGLMIGIKPLKHQPGSIPQYSILLINDTDIAFHVTAELHLSLRKMKGWINKVDGPSVNEIGQMSFDNLNDSPQIKVDCWPDQKIEGKIHHYTKTIKIKPKSFFNKLLPTPLVDEPTHLYPIFDQLPGVKERLPIKPVAAVSRNQQANEHELFSKASAPTEIDLHIEKLTKDHADMNPTEIMQLQLKHLEFFFWEAVSNKTPRIYIIHGKGTGKLQKAVSQFLEEHFDLCDYNNDYHPKYGHGATEVNFMYGR